MTTDSSTGGYLLPVSGGANPSPAPLDDEALENFLHDFISGITGISAANVRPRWQPVPPNALPQNTDWCAFGILERPGDNLAVAGHIPAAGGNPGYDVVRRHEVLSILCSFYGPNADKNTSLFREGLAVGQNREVLQLNNMGLQSVGNPLTVPALVNEIWQRRVDLNVKIKRLIVLYYPVLDLASAGGSVITDQSPLTRNFLATNS